MSEITVSLHEGWIKDKDGFEFSENFVKIIRFFMITTPCDLTSSSWKSMNERNWSKDVWTNGRLRDYLMRSANLSRDFNLKVIKNLDDMTSAATNVSLHGIFHNNRDMNRVLIYNQGKQSDFMQLFYYIRCALAHGRFQVYDDNGTLVYVMEAVKRKGGTYFLRARIILKEETLINWLETIMNGEEKFKRSMSLKLNDYKEDIIRIINRNDGKITKKIIVESIQLRRNDANRLIDSLKKEGIILYDKVNRTWIVKQ